MKRELKFRAWDGERMKEVLTLGLNEGFISTPKIVAPIEDFEVMQYTGLKDKNGVEEYEDDIEKAIFTDSYGKEVEVKGRVVFSNGVFELIWNIGTSHYPLHRLWQREVIGNIYENSDLLV